MRTQAMAWTRISMGGMLLALFLGAGGCIPVPDLGLEKPNPEIAVQTAEYGTITQVTSARMKDNEIHLGDIAITVDTDDGRVVIVSQPEDDIYSVGDRVRILRDTVGFIRVQVIN